MVNLIAQQRIVPELVQQEFTGERVVAELRQIIPNGQPRDQMLAGLRAVRSRLRGTAPAGVPLHAADRAAKAVMGLLRKNFASSTRN